MQLLLHHVKKMKIDFCNVNEDRITLVDRLDSSAGEKKEGGAFEGDVIPSTKKECARWETRNDQD